MFPNGSENLEAMDWRPMKKMEEMRMAREEMMIWTMRSEHVDPTTKAKIGRYVAWEGKGGFNVTSTCECSDGMCHGKGPLFENSTRDDLSSKTMSGN